MTTIRTQLFTHWKTTLQGLLVASIAIITALQALPPTASKATISGAVLVALLGVLMKDSGTTPATLPGSSTPVAVPSHEVPDNPVAKVVKSK